MHPLKIVDVEQATPNQNKKEIFIDIEKTLRNQLDLPDA